MNYILKCVNNMLLRVNETLGKLPSISGKGDNFCIFLFVFPHNQSFLKKVYSKRKKFAPKGANSFHLEQTHFLRETKQFLKELLPFKVHQFLKSFVEAL